MMDSEFYIIAHCPCQSQVPKFPATNRAGFKSLDTGRRFPKFLSHNRPHQCWLPQTSIVQDCSYRMCTAASETTDTTRARALRSLGKATLSTSLGRAW
ncbi:hypothetical protein BC938DRAFT_472374 [Jimgerdemannia flammicorona]|uniref:Uncharacterized protein n=1 Tax=Jimgerdemannia flammicorona TaxID=994334 RepID=A0A433Q683_9FUNG|nr:hypothetical protein BC938DRAFT_472374 [Jimgerdemannia flammicorona]